MDSDLYDEFGNYIGPDLDSESEEEDDQNFFEQDEIDVGSKHCIIISFSNYLVYL